MSDGIRLLLLKHQLSANGPDAANQHRQHPVPTCIPEASVLIDQCRKHFDLVAGRGHRHPGRNNGGGASTVEQALTATATMTTIAQVLCAGARFFSGDDKMAVMNQVVSMTLDTGCPTALAQDLLEALVTLASGDPAKILQAFASRLCFYCESQSDAIMQDQVAEVGGMIRAVEYVTRVVFTGEQSDLCAQFLYADLTSHSLGAQPFPSQLSEEGLNDLLCGRKEFPHVAQLINGCLGSRLAAVRRCAYETLSNVALFAKEHRGTKAFDMLLRLRLRGAEKDPRLIAVLAALVWEVVFVDQELQDERLVGSGTPGSYGLLDDLFAESLEVRLVAFHSVGRLLFHSWIPPPADAVSGGPPASSRNQGGLYRRRHQGEVQGAEEQEDAERKEEGLGDSLPCPSSPSSSCSGSDSAAVTPACAEQALLRVALILHENTGTENAGNTISSGSDASEDGRRGGRRFDPRVRAAARGLASGLRSRKRRARHLLARSALLAVDHGLANGSLDALRERFPAPIQSWSRGGFRGGGGGGGTNGDDSSGHGGADGGWGGLSTPKSSTAMSVSSSSSDGGSVGWNAGGGGGVHFRGHADEVSPGGSRAPEQRRFWQEGGDRMAEDVGSHRGGREGVRGTSSGGQQQETGRLGSDTLQYASAIKFFVEMLSREDQEEVTAEIESRLAAHFDDADDFPWQCEEEEEEEEGHEMQQQGEGWFMSAAAGGEAGGEVASDGSAVFGKSARIRNTNNVDARAAAAWLAGGGGASIGGRNGNFPFAEA